MPNIYNMQPTADSEKTIAFQSGTFAYDVLAGLIKYPKALSSKYFYDAKGSKLFEQIMQLPEYYPTRCEAQILDTHKQALLEMCQKDYYHLVDLGAGDAAKTRILIDYFYKNNLRFEYIPVDISESAVQELTDNLHRTYPLLPVRSVATDYFTALQWLHGQVSGRKLVLFLGSNIGNFTTEECKLFLSGIWQWLDEDDRLLTGFDLKKNATVIRNAYNDSRGVTTEFNKNLLQRINVELGGNFNLDNFEFYASYDPVSGFVKSYMISNRAQQVYIEAFKRSFEFEAWETIHMENSRKFGIREIEELALACRYEVETHLFDSQQYFTDSIWKVMGKNK